MNEKSHGSSEGIMSFIACEHKWPRELLAFSVHEKHQKRELAHIMGMCLQAGLVSQKQLLLVGAKYSRIQRGSFLANQNKQGSWQKLVSSSKRNEQQC